MERLTCVMSIVNKFGSHGVGVEFCLEMWFGMAVNGRLGMARVFRQLTAVCITITIVAMYKWGDLSKLQRCTLPEWPFDVKV